MKPRKSLTSDYVMLRLFTKVLMIYCIKSFFEIMKAFNDSINEIWRVQKGLDAT